MHKISIDFKSLITLYTNMMSLTLLAGRTVVTSYCMLTWASIWDFRSDCI